MVMIKHDVHLDPEDDESSPDDANSIDNDKETELATNCQV
jgi:hypothetical protein